MSKPQPLRKVNQTAQFRPFRRCAKRFLSLKSGKARIKPNFPNHIVRRDFINKKITKETAEAKASAKAGNKSVALRHLKRKKMYEKDV